MNVPAVDPFPIAWSERILERARHVAQLRVGAQIVHSMRVETYQDHVTQDLVAKLSTDVLREKLGDQETDVPFHTEVPVEVPARPLRKSAVGGLVAAVGLVVGAILVSSLMLAVAAVLVAALAVWTLVEPMDAMPTIAKIHGHVSVKTDFFHTYPENSVALPDEYGKPHRVAVLGNAVPDLWAHVAR